MIYDTDTINLNYQTIFKKVEKCIFIILHKISAIEIINRGMGGGAPK